MEVLRQYFGFSSFREGQQTLIDAVLAGRDVLGVMPTGGGKSLCYELPALLLPGLTLVISPLISLMKDQVMALQNAGIPAGCIHSAMSVEELREAYRDTRFGAYKILYIAPERLLTDGFCALAQELEISLLAVDEAHCISQWGQDFRPSYLKILDFLQKLPRRPALAAFTATATAQVRSDIVRILQLQDPVTVVTGFDRPNLRFEVLRPQDKRRTLLELLEERRDKSGIVYCATRKGVEQICELLQSSGFAASRYHAGLSPDERRQNQEDFICDRCTVMVATNAFGMGIDKSNVSYVIHCNMPKSVEAYYQEAGRAGRDGAPADCILLFSPGDITTAKYLILNQTENDELTDEERQAVQAQDLIRLEQMTGYCKTTGCLRGYLLDYFGQPHAPRCENCGNCQAEYDLQDLTREAQMILSCVVRMRTRLGYCVGTALLGQVLRGSRAARVRELGLEDLPTYGLMRDLPAGRIRELLELLEAGGYLQTDPVHGGVDTTPQAAGRGLRQAPAPAGPAGPGQGQSQGRTAQKGGGRPARRAQGAAAAPFSGAAHPGLHHLHQRDAARHGGQTPAHHRGAAGSLRHRPGQGRALRRRVFEGTGTLRTDAWEECTMNIRRFAPADADAVVRVSELATRITSGKVYDQTFVEEMVENQTRAYFLRRGEQMHFYVACEDDGTVIGCAAIGRPYRDDPAESCLYSVFVLPEKQNRGVGRALIGAIERDPWFLTARRVIIPASINALHFYQGLGYTFAPGGDTLDEEQLYCLEKFPQPRT